MAIDVKFVDDGLRVIQSGGKVFHLSIELLHKNTNKEYALFTKTFDRIQALFITSLIYLQFREENGIIVIETEEKLEKDVRVRYLFELETDSEKGEIFIPAVWYKDNSNGAGCFPKYSTAKSWSFAETRMSIPSCIEYSVKNTHFFVAKKSAETFSNIASSGFDKNTLFVDRPCTELPYSYRGKQTLIETSKINFTEEENTISQTFYCFISKEEDALLAYESFVRAYFSLFDDTSIPALTSSSYASLKLTRLLNMVREDGYLIMGEGNGGEQPVYEFTAASFLVKSLEAALCFAKTDENISSINVSYLLQAKADVALRTKLENDDSLLDNLAILIGTYFLRYEEDGRFQDCVNIHTGEYGGYLGLGEHPEFKYLINARCNGEAMSSYVELYTVLKDKGIVVPEFLEVTKRVATFYLDNQLSNGSFGRWWSKNGKPENTQGTNGAYIAKFLIKLDSVLEKSDDLKERVKTGIRRAINYYKELIEEGLFYGDTLDADSCDKEAGVILLDLMLTYYDVSKDESVLPLARKAAAFILSWIWQQDIPFALGTVLDNENFHTKGVSSVSVAHHHLDFYGMLISVLFLKYYNITGDELYKNQAENMIKASRQLIATADNLLGRDKSFIGWQPEQMNHTFWDYFNNENKMNGSASIDIAWVNVLGYSSCQALKERFPDILF